MKALHFGRFYNGNLGGIERHVGLLLKGLAEHMHIDNVVAHDGFKQNIFQTDGYTVHQLPSIGKFAGTALCPTMPFYVRQLFNEHKYDIVHLHLPDPMSQIAIELLPSDVKIVISWHSDIIRQKNIFKLYKPYLNRLLKRADIIEAATPGHFSSSTQLGTVDPNKLIVIPYGLDPEPYDQLNAIDAGTAIRKKYERKKIIFALGRHVYYKGFEYLIQAMADIHDDTILLLGGTGPLTPKLKELSKQLGVENRVTFVGRIPDSDLASYYHAADIFCMPSVEPSEGFGQVQIEAMFCKKPVICCELYNGVTYVNQNGKTGLVVPPRDPSALADALNVLLGNDNLRQHMGETARERALSEFTTQHMWEGTLAMYKNLLSKH